MSIKTDLMLAYYMGFEDALAKRKPDTRKTAILVTVDFEAENRKLHALLDYALPIAMYAASTEEGDRIRDLMREVEV